MIVIRIIFWTALAAVLGYALTGDVARRRLAKARAARRPAHETVPTEVIFSAAQKPQSAEIDPDCIAGKHSNCSGFRWDNVADELTSCKCSCHRGAVGS